MGQTDYLMLDFRCECKMCTFGTGSSAVSGEGEHSTNVSGHGGTTGTQTSLQGEVKTTMPTSQWRTSVLLAYQLSGSPRPVVRNNESATPQVGGYADHPHGVQDKAPLDNKAPSSDNSQA